MGLGIGDAGDEQENDGRHNVHPVLGDEAPVVLRLATITSLALLLELLNEAGGVGHRSRLDCLQRHDRAELEQLIDVIDRYGVALVRNGFEVHRLVVDADDG